MFLRPCLAIPPRAIARQQQQQRTYTRLSTAFSVLTSFGKPLIVHANRTLHYPRSSLYEIISDIGSYPQFIPLVYDAQILAKARPKSGTSDNVKELPALASLTIGARPLADYFGSKDNDGTVCFVSNVYCSPAEGIVEAVAGEEKHSEALKEPQLLELGYSEQQHTARDDGRIKDLGPKLFTVCRTRWRLSKLEKDKTEVDLRIEIRWKDRILAGMSQAAAPTMAEQMIQAFENRARDTLHTW